jgi:hypothetical protein
MVLLNHIEEWGRLLSVLPDTCCPPTLKSCDACTVSHCELCVT